MKWQDNTLEPVDTVWKLQSPGICVSVSREKSDTTTWQHMLISFGEFSSASVDDCKTTWPREALMLLRQRLDAFEARLSEMEKEDEDLHDNAGV